MVSSADVNPLAEYSGMDAHMLSALFLIADERKESTGDAIVEGWPCALRRHK